MKGYCAKCYGGWEGEGGGATAMDTVKKNTGLGVNVRKN